MLCVCFVVDGLEKEPGRVSVCVRACGGIWVCGSVRGIVLPVLADDEHELLERRRGPVHLQVDDHVRELRDVELDALEDRLLVRVLPL